MIKVMIVDDSALIRRVLKDILEKDEEIEVIESASNGMEALEKLETIKPDLITLDIEMPVMDGISTLKEIVKKYNIPVVMISSLSKIGADLTLQAFDIGAIDFLTKPENVFGLSSLDLQEDIIKKIKTAATIGTTKELKSNKKVNKLKKTINREAFPERKIAKLSMGLNNKFKNLIVIGTSTGGPRALQEVIPILPKEIDGAVVVVQHMPPNFTKSLAERLNKSSELKVKEAKDGDVISRGEVYIAPGDYHMRVEKQGNDLIIKLSQEEKEMGLRPTADILMESVAKIRSYNKIGVILTGMGSDGSKGILELKKNGAFNISQDEATSVVFGMPKAAISTGCVDLVVPLDEVAETIINNLEV